MELEDYRNKANLLVLHSLSNHRRPPSSQHVHLIMSPQIIMHYYFEDE